MEGTLGQVLGVCMCVLRIVRCQVEKEQNLGLERVLEASKTKAMGCLSKLLGGRRQAQLLGMPGLLHA